MKSEFDNTATLAAAKVEEIPFKQIDLTDTSFEFRDGVCPPCSPDDFEVVDGVVDLAAVPHPGVLLPNADDDRFRIVHSFGRLDVMQDNPAIKKVRCLVLRTVPEEVAVLVAARMNLGHGRMLTTGEKRRCFVRELEAQKTGGYALPSNREFGQIYGLSHVTVGTWRDEAMGAAKKPKQPAGGGGTQRRAKANPGDDDGKSRKGAAPRATSPLEAAANLKAAARDLVEAVDRDQLGEDERELLTRDIREVREMLRPLCGQLDPQMVEAAR
ncbi:MAG: hypothetical protein V2A79_02920 [Planctomycetota bacterium]